MNPITRIERYLAYITNDEEANGIDYPISRVEAYLSKIAGLQVEIPDHPITRVEMYLAKIAGEDVELPDKPITRIEMYLSAIAGEEIDIPNPVTRVEFWLSEWQKNISLPDGYKKVLGFEFSDGTYYKITDFKLRGSDTVRMSFSVDKACNVFGCYTTTSATDNYSLYASTSSGGKYLRYDGDVYNSYFPSDKIGVRCDVVISPTGTHGMPSDSVISEKTFEGSADLCIGTTSPSAQSSKLDGNIWGDFIVDGRLKLVPCERISDNVLGYYDMVSRTFYEPIGSAPTSLGYA